MSLILALRGRRARAGESRRSIAPGGYTLDRAHTAHALTLTGALVRRGAVGAETRADETVTEADGPTDAGCRTIRAEESHQSQDVSCSWEDRVGEAAARRAHARRAGSRRKAKRAVILTKKQLAKKRTDMRNDAMRNRPTRQELDKWSFESRHEARSTYPHEWRVPSCPRSRSR